jgi:hypothetical protein
MNFSHYYHTRVNASVDEDRSTIVAGFQDIIKRGVRVNCRLINYYKGLPLSYPATIVEIDRGLLELDVHQQQAVAIDRTRRVFIKCDYFNNAILADVQNANVRRMTATLRNFAFVEIMAEKRDALRLELEPPTVADISAGALSLSGKLFDLSLGGFSIRTEERCALEKGVEVSLRVMIPDLLQNTLIKIETKACHIGTLNEGQYDICRFSIQADVQTEAVISRFIFQRQVEIIRAIKEAS